MTRSRYTSLPNLTPCTHNHHAAQCPQPQVINKSEIIRRGYIDSTKLERAILCESEHPFIVRLRFAFQNGAKLYLVTDFYNGGNLLVHLKRNCAFPERAARFFAAEVFLAIEYLHRRGIVYRDLKVRTCMHTTKHKHISIHRTAAMA